MVSHPLVSGESRFPGVGDRRSRIGRSGFAVTPKSFVTSFGWLAVLNETGAEPRWPKPQSSVCLLDLKAHAFTETAI